MSFLQQCTLLAIYVHDSQQKAFRVCVDCCVVFQVAKVWLQGCIGPALEMNNATDNSPPLALYLKAPQWLAGHFREAHLLAIAC